MELVAKKQGTDKHARCKVLENLLIQLEIALSEGHVLFLKVRRLNILLSCARQTTEIQRALGGRKQRRSKKPTWRCVIKLDTVFAT